MDALETMRFVTAKLAAEVRAFYRRILLVDTRDSSEPKTGSL